MTSVPLSADWKDNSYDLIHVIVDRLTKMVNYKPIKVTNNASKLAEVNIDIVVQYHGLTDSIISDRGAIFMFKFWFLLCYFFGIKQRLSSAFYPQTDR